MGFAKRQQILKIHNSNCPTPSPSTLTLTPPIPSTWTRNHARARTQMRESEPLASSSSYRRITTNRSLLWVTSFEYVHEGVTRGGRGSAVRPFHVLSNATRWFWKSLAGVFRALPVPQMIDLFNFHVSRQLLTQWL